MTPGPVSQSGTVVAVFGSSIPQPGDAAYAEGVRCGAGLAAAGFAVVTGGYAGIMAAVSQGAAEAGGHVIGVTAPDVFPSRPGANRYVVEEFEAPTITRRIAQLVEMSDAVIVLPGSIGTLTELVMAWNAAFVARFSNREPVPLVTVGQMWEDVVALLTALLATDGSLVTAVATVEDAVEMVVRTLSASPS